MAFNFLVAFISNQRKHNLVIINTNLFFFDFEVVSSNPITNRTEKYIKSDGPILLRLGFFMILQTSLWACSV